VIAPEIYSINGNNIDGKLLHLDQISRHHLWDLQFMQVHITATSSDLVSVSRLRKSLARSVLIQLSKNPERVQNFLTSLTKKYRIMGNWQVFVIGRSPNLTTKLHFMHYMKTPPWSLQGKQSTSEGDDRGKQEQGR
jgi:hypothetical protein